MAIAEIIRIIAMTISNSINEKPLGLFVTQSTFGHFTYRLGIPGSLPKFPFSALETLSFFGGSKVYKPESSITTPGYTLHAFTSGIFAARNEADR